MLRRNFHPYHRETELLAKLFDKARMVTHCDELSGDSASRDTREKVERIKAAAPNPRHQDRKPDENFQGKEAWWVRRGALEPPLPLCADARAPFAAPQERVRVFGGRAHAGWPAL